MNRTRAKSWSVISYVGVLSFGLFIGFAQGQSQKQPPSEHQGVDVVELGVLPEFSLKAQIGLSGYVMKLREVSVAPGGAIAEHSHADRPGVVQTISGSWTEVRNGSETEYPATAKRALVEDEATVHWLYNDGDTPAVAIVCGLAKAS